jgi:hypothetical protein
MAVCMLCASPIGASVAILFFLQGAQGQDAEIITFTEQEPSLRQKGDLMIKMLSVVIFLSTVLSGCFFYSSSTPPRVTTTTTITCPAGMQLQSEGMCR